MKPFPVCAAALAALLVTGCARVSDTILSVKQKAEDYSEEAVRRSVEGARAYCGTVPEERRTAYRALTDVAGEGPVVEVHCDRL